MKDKRCSKCKEYKSLDNFHKRASDWDGLYPTCKACHLEQIRALRAYRKLHPEPVDVARAIFYKLKVRVFDNPWCRPAYKHVKCLMTLEDFTKFIESHWSQYMKLYRVWKKSGFSHKKTPSIDRIDSKGHYEVSNLQLLSVEENCRKAKKGIPQTEETRKKMSIAHKAYQKRIKEQKLNHDKKQQ